MVSASGWTIKELCDKQCFTIKHSQVWFHPRSRTLTRMYIRVQNVCMFPADQKMPTPTADDDMLRVVCDQGVLGKS